MKAVYELCNVVMRYILQISMSKIKGMAFSQIEPVQSEIFIAVRTIVQVKYFRFLGCRLSYKEEVNVYNKINKFNLTIGTLWTNLRNNILKNALLKFFETFSVPCCTYGCET